jgi:predicted RNA-binding protein with PUA-like domain
MKTEPSTFSIDDLKKLKKTQWEGVRNYQARNFMRDSMKIGDTVFIYHSNAKEIGIFGLAEICSDAYPDHFALNPESQYFDPKSSPENPIWFMRDVAFIKKFKHCLTLQQMKEQPALNGLMVIKTGTRLSIQPVHDTHAKLLLNLLNG